MITIFDFHFISFFILSLLLQLATMKLQSGEGKLLKGNYRRG